MYVHKVQEPLYKKLFRKNLCLSQDVVWICEGSVTSLGLLVAPFPACL